MSAKRLLGLAWPAANAPMRMRGTRTKPPGSAGMPGISIWICLCLARLLAWFLAWNCLGLVLLCLSQEPCASGRGSVYKLLAAVFWCCVFFFSVVLLVALLAVCWPVPFHFPLIRLIDVPHSGIYSRLPELAVARLAQTQNVSGQMGSPAKSAKQNSYDQPCPTQ